MSILGFSQDRPRRNVRLDTLVRLRWLAIIGQTTAVLVVYFGLLLLITKPLGAYMARVFEGEKTVLERPLGWLERGIYRSLGVDPKEDMKWTTYAVASPKSESGCSRATSSPFRTSAPTAR